MNDNYYHVTNRMNINSILSGGLNPNPPTKNYSISNDGEICLAGTPESAGFWFNGNPEDIIVLEIERDMLDSSAFIDDPSGCAYLYTERIPSQAIRIVNTPKSVIEEVQKRCDHYKERWEEYKNKWENIDLRIPYSDWNFINNCCKIGEKNE